MLKEFGSNDLLYYSMEIEAPEFIQAQKLCIANMALEIGVKDCLFIVPPSEELAGNAYLDDDGGLCSDEDAVIERVWDLDLSTVQPMVAAPHHPSNAGPLKDYLGVSVQQAFLGSCTNGRIEDLREAAVILSGHTIHPDVRMIVSAASQEVIKQAIDEGIMKILVEAGAEVTSPSCGACFGSHQGLLAPGETCISSSNRNFRGRMGSPEANIYLASPASVAAAALTGKITDPRDLLEG